MWRCDAKETRCSPPDGGTARDASADAAKSDAGRGGVAPVACQLTFPSPGRQWANSVAVDIDNRIAIAGQYDGSPDLGGGPLPMVAPNGANGFVAVFDGACKHIFSHAFPEAGLGVSFTPTGDLVWNGTTTYNPHYLQLHVFDAAGNVKRTQTFVPQGGGSALATSIAVDVAGNLFLAGNFNGSLDLGGGAMVGPASGGGTDIFVARLDATGNYVWGNHYGAPEGVGPQPLERDIQVRGLAVTGNGNVAVAGLFAASLDLGGGDLGTPVFPHYKGFLAALGASTGAHAWSKAWQDTLPENAGAVVAGPAGLFFGGYTTATVDFGTGPVVAPDGGSVGLLAMFKNDGTNVWASNLVAGNPTGMSASVGTVTYATLAGYGAFTTMGAEVPLTPLSAAIGPSVAVGPWNQIVLAGGGGAYSAEDVLLYQRP